MAFDRLGIIDDWRPWERNVALQSALPISRSADCTEAGVRFEPRLPRRGSLFSDRSDDEGSWKDDDVFGGALFLMSFVDFPSL